MQYASRKNNLVKTKLVPTVVKIMHLRRVHQTMTRLKIAKHKVILAASEITLFSLY